MSKDGDVKSVFRRFCELSHGIKEACGGADAFMFNDHLGFVGACPSNLGTGLRASVMVKLVNLNEHVPELEALCTKYSLQPRGSAGEHSKAEGGKYDVSNKQRIGFSEAQLAQKLIDGVNEVIKVEKRLENGEEINQIMKELENPKLNNV